MLHLHYFERLEVFKGFYGSRGSGVIYGLLSGGTLSKTLLVVSVALESSHGERVQRF